MKKAIVLSLVSLMLLGLAACSGSADQTASAAPAASSDQPIRLARMAAAPHGTRSFAVIVVALQGDTIVGVSLDEYQFMSTDVAVGVPNSDAVDEGGLGSNYADPTVVLGSKRENTDYYSSHMAEAAGATVPIDENYDAIEAHVTGMTVAELEEEVNGFSSGEDAIDAVSGATLADTRGYLEAILETAKSGS